MQGLILEGIPGSGKTVFLRALLPFINEHHRGPLWVATEQITERVLEPLKEAQAVDARTHLRSHLAHLEKLSSWERRAPMKKDTETLFILERFHLSVGIHVSGISRRFLASTERRLGKVNATLVWFYLSPRMVLKRTVLDTIAHRGKAWRAYVETLGANHLAVARHYVKEQKHFKTLFDATDLPKLRLEIDPFNLTPDLIQVRAILGFRKHLPSPSGEQA